MSAFRRILVAVDGSEAAARGLREALRLAKAEGAQLYILHVVNESYPYIPLTGAPPLDILPGLVAHGRNLLDQALAQAKAQGVKAKAILRESAERTAAASIVREAARQRAQLIALGTHGRRGLRRLVLGSDAEQVVRSAPVPVLLVRAPS